MPKEIKTIKFMNFPTDKLLPSAVKDSDALRLFSSQCWSENKCQVSTKLLINQFLSVMLILEKICTTISSWVVEQLCSQVSQKDLVKKLLLWLHQQWKSRFSLLKKENSWSGLVVQSCHLCQLSKPCGSLKPSIKKLVPKSFTENVSDKNKDLLFSIYLLFFIYYSTKIPAKFIKYLQSSWFYCIFIESDIQ